MNYGGLRLNLMDVTMSDSDLAQWNGFVEIVAHESENGSDCFIYCIDNTMLTSDYANEYLIRSIELAQSLEADLLAGGLGKCDMPVQLAEHLFRVENFRELALVVVYKKFYPVLLSSENQDLPLDIQLSKLSRRAFVVSPFISSRKVKLADCEGKQNTDDQCFKDCHMKLNLLRKVGQAFGQFS